MNIYNDSSIYIQQAGGQINGNFTNLTTQNLIAKNAAIDNIQVDQTAIFASAEVSDLANHSIVVAGPNGSLNGLAIGNNKEVLVSNSIDAVWTNSLDINTLTCNDITINGTQNGDLLVVNGGALDRLPIGSSGTFLQSTGTLPSWSPIPNPFIVGGLQVNNNLEISNFPNRTIITDNTGFVVSERMMYSSGIATINTTPSQIYGSATWNFTQNAWYSVKVQINCSTNSQFYGDVKILTFVVGNVYSLMNPNTWFCDFTYNHTTITGTYGIALENFTTTSGSANLSYSIRVERMPTPQIVL